MKFEQIRFGADRLWLPLVLSAAVLASACGGGGGGGSGGGGSVPDDPFAPPMTQAAMSPLPGAIEVSTTTTLALTLSHAVRPATVNDQTVTLLDTARGEPVEASFAVDGAALNITPAQPLALATSYRLALSDGIRGSSGERMVATESLFATADGRWFAQQREASDNSTEMTGHHVGVDGAGNGVVLFERLEGTRSRVYASNFDASTGVWSFPARVGVHETAVQIEDLRLTVSRSGVAIALWRMTAGPGDNRRHLWFSRSDTAAPGAWTLPHRIDGGDEDVEKFDVATDDAGRALVLFTQRGFSVDDPSVQYSRFLPEFDAWTFPDKVPRAQGDGAQANPRVAMNRAGDAIVFWSAATGVFRAQRLHRDGAAGTVMEIAGEGAAVRSDPHLALAGNGDALIAWNEFVAAAPTRNIWARRIPAGGDQPQPRIAVNAAAADESLLKQLAMDNRGNAIVLWERASQFTRIYVRRLDAASGQWEPERWVSEASRDGAPVLSATGPSVALDAAGNAHVTWFKYRDVAGTADLWTTRYNAPGKTWGASAWLVEGVITIKPNAQAATDSSGRTLMAWPVQEGLIRRIHSMRFHDLNRF